MPASLSSCILSFDGTGGIRTLDLPLRRRSLYPAELQPQLLEIIAGAEKAIDRL